MGRRLFQSAAVDALGRLDLDLFRFINRDCASPWLDGVMRFLSGNPYFWPALAALAVGLIWKGGSRGVVFLVTAAVAAGLANEFVVEPLKAWAQRPRPYVAFPEIALLRVGKGNPQGSMPSAHALNLAMLAVVTGWYYQRSLAVVVPIALAVGFSRIYNGVHYPSDVLAGMALGAATAIVTLVLLDRVWRALQPLLVSRWPRLPGSWLVPAGKAPADSTNLPAA
jgi:undecaprenyl-diphosphatase